MYVKLGKSKGPQKRGFYAINQDAIIFLDLLITIFKNILDFLSRILHKFILSDSFLRS